MKNEFPLDRLMLDAMTTLLVLFVGLFAQEAIKEKAQTAQQSNITNPEKHILVEMEWDPKTDVDIDLWVKAPMDQMPVGYSRTSDRQSSYLRDDKGVYNDLSHFNYETTNIQALSPGIYVVNVHWYGNLNGVGRVPVQVRATYTSGHGSSVFAANDMILTFKGQEQTAFSFEVDSEGAVIAGSISFNFIPLRNSVPSE